MTRIDADLVHVLRDASRHSALQQRPSVFDSTGWAVEDQVAMDLVLAYAEDLGIGTQIELESVTNDPRDPYEFLSRASVKNKPRRVI